MADLTDPKTTELDTLARELYEADATWNQGLFPGLPIEHWDDADAATRARWLNVARAAVATLAS